MECYTLNNRSLLLLCALVALAVALAFAAGYYTGLRNVPPPFAERGQLAEELLTAFLEAPVRGQEDEDDAPPPPPPVTGAETVAARPIHLTPAVIPAEGDDATPSREAVEPPAAEERPSTPPGEASVIGYSVQVGTFNELKNAEEAAKRWRGKRYPVFIYRSTTPSGRSWITLRMGQFDDRESATRLADQLREKEGIEAVTVPLRGNR